MTFRADMHCHSTCSDGTNAPEELIELAAEFGIQGLSITDHDTYAAYTSELFNLAEEKGIKLCTGIEFSCTHRGANVHVLGYNFGLDSMPLSKLCERHVEARKVRNLAIVSNLKKHGMVINPSDLYSPLIHHRVVGRPHIADLMVKKGFVGSFQEAFTNYLGEGQCCYEAGTPFDVESTLEIIHEAGGKAFIAHPHIIKSHRVVSDLVEMDFDGIECYYGRFHPNEVRKWVKIAESHDMLVCGGSDYHGRNKEHTALGSSWINEEGFEKIYEPK